MPTESTTCSCFTENLERVKSRLHEQGEIPEGAIDVHVGWQGQIFMLSGGDYAPVNPKIEFEFRKPKKHGGHTRNLSKQDVSICANYCCFCGRKYKKNDKE